MANILNIILAVLAVAELIATVCYVIEIKNGYSTKTLINKIIGSSIFVATGVVAALSVGGFSSLYSKFIVIGLIGSWFGDILLHRAANTVRYISGGLGFLLAHVMYITAFIKASAEISGDGSFITKQNLIIMACVYVIAIILYFVLKLKAGKLLVPIMIYALVLCFMLSKAISLGILISSESMPGAAMLCAGASLFVLSDYMLGVSFLGKTTYPKQVVNMASYFPAQLLIALSIIFIG